VRHKFTGQEWDAETDLYYYGARYYDPKLARFISADTIVPEPFYLQSLNRYAYCVNNPVVLRDLDGHDWDSFSNWASDTWNTFSNWVSSGWDSLTNWASSGGGGNNMNFQSNDNSMPSVPTLDYNNYRNSMASPASSVSIGSSGGASLTSVIGGGGGSGSNINGFDKYTNNPDYMVAGKGTPDFETNKWRSLGPKELTGSAGEILSEVEDYNNWRHDINLENKIQQALDMEGCKLRYGDTKQVAALVDYGKIPPAFVGLIDTPVLRDPKSSIQIYGIYPVPGRRGAPIIPSIGDPCAIYNYRRQ
jgi:RHS repeat-associated protein